jgi:hypothetical protein
MPNRRIIGNLVAMLFLFASGMVSVPWLADGLRDLALGYISINILLRAWAGYRRRRPHWTPDSWRRYLRVSSVPVGALVIMVFMMAALEWRLAIVGTSQSTIRGLWIAGTLIFMFIGTVGLVAVIEWLNQGDPTGQCALPKWLTFGPRKTA